MPLNRIRWLVALSLGLLLDLLTNLSATEARNPLQSLTRITTVKCKSFNPQLVSIEKCSIVSNKNETKIVILSHLYERPITNVQVRCQIFRKQRGAYVPFIIDMTLNWCDFLSKRNVELVHRVAMAIGENTNMFKVCPFDEEYIFLNVTLTKSGEMLLPFKLPLGEFRLDVTATGNRDVREIVNIYIKIIG